MRFVLLFSLAVILAAVPCFGQETAPAGPFTDVEVTVCAAIEERQPVGAAESFGADVGQVFCWTRCLGAVDTTAIQHVWTREGETMATVDLPVKSSAWRTWSSKQILPSWTGNWEVRVLDAGGNILKAVAFKIEPQAAAPVMEAEEEPESQAVEEPAAQPEDEPQDAPEQDESAEEDAEVDSP